MGFIDISFVTITDELVKQVAVRVQRPETEVRAYISDKEQQDDALLRAFLFFGVGPMNKRFSSDRPTEDPNRVSMGCSVGMYTSDRGKRSV